MRTFLISVKGRDSPKVQVEADYDHLGQCSLQITAGLCAADLVVQELPTEAHERFFAGHLWFALKNLIGWTLILLSLVVGPLVPGPGGIPLFLIGFALVTFPGKRRLTARVLRGKRVRLQGRAVLLTIAAVSLIVPAFALWLLGPRLDWLQTRIEQGLPTTMAIYIVGVAILGTVSWGAILLVNLLLRAVPPIRRHVRPWLRSHRLRLLPPRRRRRHAHEPGIGPFRLKDEILSILKRPRRAHKGE